MAGSPPKPSCAALSKAGPPARPLPRAIVELQVAVEAFETAVDAAREEGAVNDDALRQAARRALARLREEPSVAPHTFDRTRAREEMTPLPDQRATAAGIGLPDRASPGWRCACCRSIM